jgi:hypothetical protein
MTSEYMDRHASLAMTVHDPCAVPGRYGWLSMNRLVIVKVAVIANAVKQSMNPKHMDCHVAALLAMTALIHA